MHQSKYQVRKIKKINQEKKLKNEQENQYNEMKSQNERKNVSGKTIEICKRKETKEEEM